MDQNYGVNNTPLFLNLARFTSVGPRNAQSAVLMFHGHQSKCFQSGECNKTAFALFRAVFDQRSGCGQRHADGDHHVHSGERQDDHAPKPGDTILQRRDERSQAILRADGGRIIFVGERAPYYGTFIEPVENDFFRKMGAVLRNPGATGGKTMSARQPYRDRTSDPTRLPPDEQRSRSPAPRK